MATKEVILNLVKYKMIMGGIAFAVIFIVGNIYLTYLNYFKKEKE